MKHHRALILAATLCALSGAVGCRKSAPTEVTPVAIKPKPQPVDLATPEQLKQAKCNELGDVPILEYHEVLPQSKYMTRSVQTFKNDLERLYKEGYRPVLMRDYLANRIDVPLGKSPVILTFDDARGSQFRYLPDGSVDPNCAVGILQDFQKKHPDFPTKAVFYVLPRGFDQPSLRAKKMQDLLTMGSEIGNHTTTHPNLKRLSDAKVQQELAGCVRMVQEAVPDVKMESVALPMGVLPKNRKLLLEGEAEGVRYSNRAALLAGASPAHATVSPKFNALRIPRILAVEGPMGITYWLNDLKNHPERRYVSDGDPNTTAIPRYMESQIDKNKLQGSRLRVY